MDKTHLFVSLFLIFGLSSAFDAEHFLKDCHKEPSFFVCFYIEELKDCLVCENVTITPMDSASFKINNFHIADEECVVFHGGDVGVVNSDFFKQFPYTKKMTFENVAINLESSEELVENANMEIVGIIKSKVRGNHRTNALHSLPNLRKFVLTDANLEDQTIDEVLLQKSSKLDSVTLLDSGFHPPRNENLPLLKNIHEDAFENLHDLRRVYFIVHNMTIVPPKLLKNKSKLNYAHISGRFEKFPENLPHKIEDLTVSFHNFEKLSRDDLGKFIGLQSFSMYWSKLAVIDEDAFDDLMNLKYLTINSNQLMTFTPRHLKNNKKIVAVGLSSNPLNGEVDLSELGLKESEDKTVFVRQDIKRDSNEINV